MREKVRWMVILVYLINTDICGSTKTLNDTSIPSCKTCRSSHLLFITILQKVRNCRREIPFSRLNTCNLEHVEMPFPAIWAVFLKSKLVLLYPPQLRLGIAGTLNSPSSTPPPPHQYILVFFPTHLDVYVPSP